jgi:general secretion pathway protein I
MNRARAFSLLEVMFAVALFGAVVTFILSAEAGLIAGNRTAANMSQAALLARCRMSELEEKQLKLGFPEIEEKDESNACCDDKETAGFTCKWQVERVKLPEVQTLGGDGGSSALSSLGSLDLGGGGASPLGSGLPSSLTNSVTGMGTMLGATNPMGGAGLDFDAGMANLGGTLQSAFGGAGAQGLLSMVFSLVYPSLKPVLESAIRRISVTVAWKEGQIDRTFLLTQYVTNPSRAGLLASMGDAGVFSADGGGGLGGLGGLLGGMGLGGGSTTPATGATH